MNLLGIVQSIHQEAALPGAAPTTVAGQSGRAADLVRWAIEAYNDIQRERNGRWKWLRRKFTLNTVADTISYAYTDCTDVDAATPIARFRDWHFDENEPPLIYLVSDGQSTERKLTIHPWAEFRDDYQVGTHTSAYPGWISRDVLNKLYLGPKPDGIYLVSGDFWRSNQILADDNDIPEMPTDYHMLIVYRAIVKYGFNIVAQEKLARARTEGEPLWNGLVQNQHHGLWSLTTSGPLA